MWSYTLFPKICNMSLTAGLVICLVLAVRILLRKEPKIFSYMLWLVVLFRLLCPVSFSMPVSFLELMKIQTSVTGRIEYIPEDIVFQETPGVQLPDAALTESINERLKEDEEQLVADPLEAPMAIATFFWMTGMAGMLIYSIFKWRHLKKTLTGAVPVQRNIYLSDYIPSPFVIGFLRPKIYLPSFLSEQEKGYILLHEQTHIRRGDHIVKGLFFMALLIHWFNPLVWVAFVICGRDMEMSCDEIVMKKMKKDIRAEYCTSLLRLSVGRSRIVGAPLAFGENSIKSRIKNVMCYRKPAFWILVSGTAAVIILTVILMANPLKKGTDLIGASYQVTTVLYESPLVSVTYSEETAPFYCITADYCLMEKQRGEQSDWKDMGELGRPVFLTKQELLAMYMLPQEEVKDLLDEVSVVYRVDTDNRNQRFYLVMQTRAGELLISVGYGQGEQEDVCWLFATEKVSGGMDMNYLQFSIESWIKNQLGYVTQVNIFSTYEIGESTRFLVEGFLSDGDSERSDMGYAVFMHEEGGYKLKDCHVYANAAVDGNKIYFAENPVIADKNGVFTDETAYDVILSNNEELTFIKWLVDGEKTLEESVSHAPSMTLMKWKDIRAEESVELHYLDKFGEQIEDIPIQLMNPKK